jgi:WD40 repeat protein
VELPGQLLAAACLGDGRREEWQPLEDLFCDLTFLEAKAEAGMAFDLAGELTEAVLAVGFSADSSLVCSGSFDGTVRAWNTATGAEQACCRGHQGQVTAVAFSQDGKRIVSGSKDRTVRVWDAVTGAELACLRGHERSVSAVGFRADGRVYSVSWDRTLRVWDVAGGACLEVVSEGWQPWIMAPDHLERAWQPMRRRTELAIHAVGGEAVAWFPVPPHVLACHPAGRAWAMSTRTHVNLVSLEGRSAY